MANTINMLVWGHKSKMNKDGRIPERVEKALGYAGTGGAKVTMKVVVFLCSEF